MPIPPSTYAGSAPITAGQLDTDLYTYTPGNYHTPNGVLFHANRPLLVEGLTSASLKQASSSSGSFTSLANTILPNVWKNYGDNAVLFGPGADLPSSVAAGQLLATVPGSSGVAGSAGGYYLMWGFPVIGATTNAGGFGAAINEFGGTVIGAHQLSSTTRDNASFAIDLVPANAGTNCSLVGYCADTSGGSFAFNNNTQDYSGELCRWYGLWAGVQTGGGTVASVPTPQATFAGTSGITSALLNGLSGLGGALKVLNNPPMLRAANLDSTSIANSTVTTVPVTGSTSGTQVDNYSGLNAGTNTWTAPLDGLYLVHGFVNYTANTGGQRQAAIQVNGSLNLWGPSYSAAGSGGTSPQVTRILDLHAGDTLKLVTQQNSGGALALIGGQPCRLVAVWLGALWAGGNPLTWQPPDTGFRWQAGTRGPDLPGLWQTHMAGDLNFLINRPYLLSYQTVAQSGLAYNAFDTITMNNLTGRVHATPGDNYDGWTSGASNSYTAQVSGWYLVCAGYASTAIGGTYHPVAGISQSPAGYSTPDWYQHMRSVSTTFIPGAEALGLYYLRESQVLGDSITPVYAVQDGVGTMTTSVATGQESHLEAVWVSN